MSNLEERSDELDKKLEENPIDNNIATLIKYAKRNRRLINWVIASLVLDFILTFVLIVIFVRQQHNQTLISNNKNALISNCEGNNAFRRDNLALWNYILRIPPTVPQTDKQKQITIDFSKFVVKTFTPRDCKSLVKN